MDYDWTVVEHYPDGTTWSHFFTTEIAATSAVQQMQASHPARIYTLTSKGSAS